MEKIQIEAKSYKLLAWKCLRDTRQSIFYNIFTNCYTEIAYPKIRTENLRRTGQFLYELYFYIHTSLNQSLLVSMAKSYHRIHI